MSKLVKSALDVAKMTTAWSLLLDAGPKSAEQLVYPLGRSFGSSFDIQAPRQGPCALMFSQLRSRSHIKEFGVGGGPPLFCVRPGPYPPLAHRPCGISPTTAGLRLSCFV